MIFFPTSDFYKLVILGMYVIGKSCMPISLWVSMFLLVKYVIVFYDPPKMIGIHNLPIKVLRKKPLKNG